VILDNYPKSEVGYKCHIFDTLRGILWETPLSHPLKCPHNFCTEMVKPILDSIAFSIYPLRKRSIANVKLLFIHYLLLSVVHRAMLKTEAQQSSMLVNNPANFGAAFDRHCMCEVPGQVSCPAWQPLPTEMTGKGRRKLWEAAKEAASSANRP